MGSRVGNPGEGRFSPAPFFGSGDSGPEGGEGSPEVSSLLEGCGTVTGLEPVAGDGGVGSPRDSPSLRKSARLAGRGSDRALERAIAWKLLLREGTQAGVELVPGCFAAGCKGGGPSSHSPRRSKIKSKGARCGIDLSEVDVLSLRDFMGLPF